MYIKVTDKQYSMDARIKAIYDKLRLSIKKDRDRIIVFVGEEGSGKSVGAMQGCYYYDPTFDNSRIAFTLQEAIKIIDKLIENAKGDIKKIKGKAILLDEIHDFANVRRATSKNNELFINFLRRVRQFNFYIFMCIPSFFEVDSYLAAHRLAGLFQTFFYKDKFGIRFWHRKRAFELWRLRKFKDYFAINPTLRAASFPEFYPIIEKIYRTRKFEDWKGLAETKVSKEKILRDRHYNAILGLKGIMSHRKVAKLFDYSNTYIRDIWAGVTGPLSNKSLK